jgi:hypothetical protein
MDHRGGAFLLTIDRDATCYHRGSGRNPMPIKPNYNVRRADGRRVQQQKREEKEQTHQDKVARHWAVRESKP